jgi:hypothetical protein
MADWIWGVIILALIISWGIVYHLGYSAGRESLVINEWENGYRRCLFIWGKEILEWRSNRSRGQLLSSNDKAYHQDIITIECLIQESKREKANAK